MWKVQIVYTIMKHYYFFNKPSLKPLLVVLFLLCIGSLSLAQSGPGGVGNSGGTDGQPQNVLWLKADAGITETGGDITAWADQSGNGLDATGNLDPLFTATNSNLNNQPSISFPNDGSYLSVADDPLLDDGGNFSFALVLRTDQPGTFGILNKRTEFGENQAYRFFKNNNSFESNMGGFGSATLALDVSTRNYIFTTIYNGSATTYNIFDNDSDNAGAGAPASLGDEASDLFIGNFNDGDAREFDGDIAEVIIFKSTLNEAQRLIVENYLGSKYGISPSDDLFDGESEGFITDIAGIGRQTAGVEHVEASSAGLVLGISTTPNDGDYVFAAHDGAISGPSTTSSNNLTGSVAQRWDRVWYIEENFGTDDDDRFTIAFDFQDGVTGGQFPQAPASNYVLLSRTIGSGNFSANTVINQEILGDQVVFTIEEGNINSANEYTIGTLDETNSPIAGGPSQTWYSFRTGEWGDPDTWTLDGGVNPFLVNPGNDIPSTIDNVVITPGRTVNMAPDDGNSFTNNDPVDDPLDDIVLVSMTVNGVLNLGASSGHDFNDIDGSGTIIISGEDGTGGDNFPDGDVSDFANASTGGSVTVQGSNDVNLNVARTFNNIEINLTGSTAILSENYTINGDLTVENGTFQISDGTSDLTIDLEGDLLVESGGSITVANSNNRHQFNFQGDFTNNGSVAFTNRTMLEVGGSETTGIVDANFLNDFEDQTIQCNNTTNFYRIEIDKGTDDSRILAINANAASDFNLFGNVNTPSDGANVTNNPNAFALLTGTARIGTNVDIPFLNNTGNYSINEDAQLWIDGGSVSKTGTAITPYGLLRLTSGTLTVNASSGITTRDNGSILVEGGTLTTRQIRTSILGEDNIGSYTQTGGDVIVDASLGATNENYYAFSLTYTGNSFIMSGGTLTVTNNNQGGIFINSAPGNINVTGGTLICDINESADFIMTSLAPFNDVIIRKTTGATDRTLILDGGTSAEGEGPGDSAERSLTAQPLVVNGSLTLENVADNVDNTADVTLDANGQNLEIEGTLRIENGATYTPNGNITVFSGSSSSNLQLLNPASQVFNDVTVNKSGIASVNIASSVAVAPSIVGDLRIESGTFDYRTFDVPVDSNLFIAGTISSQDAASGSILLNNATVAQTITSDAGTIENLDIDNTNGVSLTGDSLVIDSTLTLTNGVFDIGTERLIVRNDQIDGSSFGSTKMIQTAGNASDGGVEFFIDADDTYTYPIGVSGKYTPVDADISLTNANTGNIQIRPVDDVLGTVAQTSDEILNYYWRVSHSGFGGSDLPTINSYEFTYDAGDASGGTPDTEFVSGKVLDENPYTRSYEGAAGVRVDLSTILFDGLAQDDDGSGSPGAGFTIENANYTAGETARFVGAPTVYYTRATDGSWFEWQDEIHWSITSHVEAPISDLGESNPGVPGAGDIVIIGSDYVDNLTGGSYSDTFVDGRHQLRLDNSQGDTEVSQLIFDSQAGGTALVVTDMSRLRVRSGITFKTSTITGTGEIVQDVGPNASDFGNIIADIGEFAADANNGWFFWLQNDGTTVVNDFDEYPTFRTFGGNSSRFFQFGKDISAKNMLIDNEVTFQVAHNLTIDSLIKVGSNLEGTIEFINTGSDITLDCEDVLLAANSGTNAVIAENAGSNTHTFRVRGDITIDNGGTFDLSNTSGTNVTLELGGNSGNNVYTDNAGITPDLYRVVMNKGSDTNSSFTINNEFTIPTPSTISAQTVEIVNGTLILNDPNIDITLTDAARGDFKLPNTDNADASSGSGGLEVRQGTVRIDGSDTGIILDGLLRVSGGTVDMDDALINNGNNFIEYSTTGNATIEVTGGTLDVGSQLRRGLTSTAGVLNYTQSGGDVTIGINAAPETNRGVFEVTNSSSFDLTGGTFTLVRGINSQITPSLLIDPSTSDFTGSTITIGNTNSPSGVQFENFGINVQNGLRINNLTIDNSSNNNPVVKLYSNPLDLDGTLTISSGSELDPQGFFLRLRGDFINDGTYAADDNLTIFASNSPQSYKGTGTDQFNDFRKNGNGTLSIDKPITVNGDFELLNGFIDDGADNSITILGNATIETDFTASGGEGLVFAGSTPQTLNGDGGNNINLGVVTIQNSEGVSIPDGAGTFTITDDLRLDGGILDIGSNSLTIANTADINEVSAFGPSNMIRTNGSDSDLGLSRVFNSATTFVFPIGDDDKYTPVSLTWNNFASAGTFTVIPIDETHPTVITLSADVLSYYWRITSDVSGNEVTLNFEYSDDDIEGDEGLYGVTAVIEEGTSSISKIGTVDDVNNELDIANQLFTANLGRDYFGGEDVDIPGTVITCALDASGDLSNPDYKNIGDCTLPDGTQPEGIILEIPVGIDMTINDADRVRVYGVVLEGTLDIGQSFGNQFTSLSGDGTLILSSGSLPSGDFSDFFDCTGGGGTLRYTGSNDYDIGSITNVANLEFTGTGQRGLPTSNITACGDFTVNGADVVKDEAGSLTVNGSFTLTTGSFDIDNNLQMDVSTMDLNGGTFTGGSSSDITVTNDLTVDGGTMDITSGSIVNASNNLDLVSGSLNSDNNAQINVTNNLDFTGGSSTLTGATVVDIDGDLSLTASTLALSGSTFEFSGSSNQSIDGTFTGTNAFDNLTVNNGARVNLSDNGKDIQIDGTLTLTSGRLDADLDDGNKFDDPVVILNTNNPVSGTLNSSNHVEGKMKSRDAFNTFYRFPTGDQGRYRFIDLNPNASSDFENIQLIVDTPPDDITTDLIGIPLGAGGDNIETVLTDKYWNVDRISGSGPVIVRVRLKNPEDGISTTGDLSSVGLVRNNAGTWVAFDTPNNQFTANTVRGITSDFSPIGVASTEQDINPLPVELLFFNGTADDGVVKLDWATATEIDNDFFEIQRSSDGSEFEVIGEVDGNGNSDILIEYDFIDNRPHQGDNFYRLKQVDFDGSFEYSDVIRVENELDGIAFNINIYPNPVDGEEFTIDVQTPNLNAPVDLVMLDATGKIYAYQSFILNQSVADIKVQIPESMQSGIYFVNVRQNARSIIRKVIIK